MAKSQRDVLQAFLEHRPARASNLVSTGDSLLSYGWYELARHSDNNVRDAKGLTVIVRNGPLYSQSTKVQFTKLGLYRFMSSPNHTPQSQGAMN